jgi:hypothetical protein
MIERNLVELIDQHGGMAIAGERSSRWTSAFLPLLRNPVRRSTGMRSETLNARPPSVALERIYERVVESPFKSTSGFCRRSNSAIPTVLPISCNCTSYALQSGSESVCKRSLAVSAAEGEIE